jgi:hypothetical protein
LIVGAVLVSGCSPPWHLRLREDRRIHIDAPAGNSTVTVPFTVRWSARDFRRISPELGTDTTGRQASPEAGYFAVFLDGTPMGPGQGFDALLRDDPACVASPTCPDAAYLQDRLDVQVTDRTAVTIDAVSGQGVGGPGSDIHSVTIVLMDARGRRIGDSSWYVSFTVKEG